MHDSPLLNALAHTSGKDLIESVKVLTTIVEPSLANAKTDDQFQPERHGYLVADPADHRTEKPMFNLAAG